MNNDVYSGVKLITDQLTNQELVALYLTATSGYHSYKHLHFYDKIKDLLTEEGKIHSETMNALDIIAEERMI